MKPSNMFGWVCVSLFMMALAAQAGHDQQPGHHGHESGMSGSQALQKLMEGNHRYVSSKFARPNSSAKRRADVAKGQHPFAVILGCADSRVPPEIVFDQGLGDLFVVRVAGNIADPASIGSIEYAVEHLGVRLVLVLGHERCGAVDATVKGADAPGHIGKLVDAIRPAVEKIKDQPGDMVDNAVRANVKLVVEQLETSEGILTDRVVEGKLKIVGGRYDLETGIVEPVR